MTMVETIRKMAEENLKGECYTTCHDDTEHEWPLIERYWYVERTMKTKGIPADHPVLALAYLSCIDIGDVADDLVFVDPWDSEKKVQNAKEYLKRCKKVHADICNAPSDDERYRIYAENPEIFVENLIFSVQETNEYKPGFDEEAYDKFKKAQDRIIKMRDEVLKRLSPRYDAYRKIIASVTRSSY